MLVSNVWPDQAEGVNVRLEYMLSLRGSILLVAAETVRETVKDNVTVKDDVAVRCAERFTVKGTVMLQEQNFSENPQQKCLGKNHHSEARQ